MTDTLALLLAGAEDGRDFFLTLLSSQPLDFVLWISAVKRTYRDDTYMSCDSGHVTTLTACAQPASAPNTDTKRSPAAAEERGGGEVCRRRGQQKKHLQMDWPLWKAFVNGDASMRNINGFYHEQALCYINALTDQSVCVWRECLAAASIRHAIVPLSHAPHVHVHRHGSHVTQAHQTHTVGNLCTHARQLLELVPRLWV